MAEDLCKNCSSNLAQQPESGTNDFEIKCANCGECSCKFCFFPIHFPASCDDASDWLPMPSDPTKMDEAHLRVYHDVRKKLQTIALSKERVKLFQGLHAQKLLKANPELPLALNEMERILKIQEMALVVQLANHLKVAPNFSKTFDECARGLDLLISKYPDRVRREVRGVFKFVPCINEDVVLGNFVLLGTRRFAAKRCGNLLEAVTNVYIGLNKGTPADLTLIRTLKSEKLKWDQI